MIAWRPMGSLPGDRACVFLVSHCACSSFPRFTSHTDASAVLDEADLAGLQEQHRWPHQWLQGTLPQLGQALWLLPRLCVNPWRLRQAWCSVSTQHDCISRARADQTSGARCCARRAISRFFITHRRPWEHNNCALYTYSGAARNSWRGRWPPLLNLRPCSDWQQTIYLAQAK